MSHRRATAQKDLSAAIKELRDEVDRYREALEQIAHFKFDVVKAADQDLFEIKELARAVLAVGGDPE